MSSLNILCTAALILFTFDLNYGRKFNCLHASSSQAKFPILNLAAMNLNTDIVSLCPLMDCCNKSVLIAIANFNKDRAKSVFFQAFDGPIKDTEAITNELYQIIDDDIKFSTQSMSYSFVEFNDLFAILHNELRDFFFHNSNSLTFRIQMEKTISKLHLPLLRIIGMNYKNMSSDILECISNIPKIHRFQRNLIHQLTNVYEPLKKALLLLNNTFDVLRYIRDESPQSTQCIRTFANLNHCSELCESKETYTVKNIFCSSKCDESLPNCFSFNSYYPRNAHKQIQYLLEQVFGILQGLIFQNNQFLNFVQMNENVIFQIIEHFRKLNSNFWHEASTECQTHLFNKMKIDKTEFNMTVKNLPTNTVHRVERFSNAIRNLFIVLKSPAVHQLFNDHLTRLCDHSNVQNKKWKRNKCKPLDSADSNLDISVDNHLNNLVTKLKSQIRLLTQREFINERKTAVVQSISFQKNSIEEASLATSSRVNSYYPSSYLDSYDYDENINYTFDQSNSSSIKSLKDQEIFYNHNNSLIKSSSDLSSYHNSTIDINSQYSKQTTNEAYLSGSSDINSQHYFDTNLNYDDQSYSYNEIDYTNNSSELQTTSATRIPNSFEFSKIEKENSTHHLNLTDSELLAFKVNIHNSSQILNITSINKKSNEYSSPFSSYSFTVSNVPARPKPRKLRPPNEVSTNSSPSTSITESTVQVPVKSIENINSPSTRSDTYFESEYDDNDYFSYDDKVLTTFATDGSSSTTNLSPFSRHFSSNSYEYENYEENYDDSEDIHYDITNSKQENSFPNKNEQMTIGLNARVTDAPIIFDQDFLPDPPADLWIPDFDTSSPYKYHLSAIQLNSSSAMKIILSKFPLSIMILSIALLS